MKLETLWMECRVNVTSSIGQLALPSFTDGTHLTIGDKVESDATLSDSRRPPSLIVRDVRLLRSRVHCRWFNWIDTSCRFVYRNIYTTLFSIVGSNADYIFRYSRLHFQIFTISSGVKYYRNDTSNKNRRFTRSNLNHKYVCKYPSVRLWLFMQIQTKNIK